MSYEPTPEHLIEAAMCLWEEVTLHRNTEPFLRAFENIGTVELRHAVMALADPCCREWNALTQDEQDKFAPYDWEWCPYFLRERCTWTLTGPIYQTK
jgi:hypothetical protein